MDYKVRPQESLMNIASRCGVSVGDILKVNPSLKKARKLFVGAEIIMPLTVGSGRPSCGGGSRPSSGGGSRPTSGESAADISGAMSWVWAKSVPPTQAGVGNVSRSTGGSSYSSSITINGTATFVTRVRSELDAIAKTSVGAKLLGSSGGAAWRKKFKVVISKGQTCRAKPQHDLDGWKKGSYIMYDHLGLPVTYGNKGTGKGCGTSIEYNPAQALPSEVWFKNMPTALLLGHELIHAYLYARGEADPAVKNDIRNHELQVVGLSPFESGEFTENKLRAQWNPPQPKRTKYSKWKKR